MKRNWIYGIFTGCVALMLLIGAVMTMPEEPSDPTDPSIYTTEPSDSVTLGTTQSVPESSVVTTAPTEQIQQTTAPRPIEPTVAPSTEATSAPTTEPTTEPTTLPTTEPTTEPTTVPTTAPTTVATQPSTELVIITWPRTISGGETGTVTIQGKPNTSYSIKVYYKSGPSSAKALADQVSDADGFVTWTWKVSKNTKPGDFKIIVSGGGEMVEVPFTVLD